MTYGASVVLQQLGRVLSWDWRTPMRIAATTLGTSLGLALIFGLASRPASSQLHWGLTTTLAWVAWVWESIFGVNAVGGIEVSGSLTFFGSNLDGSVSGGAGIGAMPLTLTVITMLVAAVAFQRATVGSINAVSALFLGVRAALLTTIPLFVTSLFVSLDVGDLAHLLGSGTGDTLQQWQSSKGDEAFSISLSSTDAFFTTAVLLVAVFAGVTLLRREWFTRRGWSTMQLLLAAPVRAVGHLAIAVVAGGLLFELVTWLVRWNTTWPSGGHGPSLSAHQWVTGFASAIAYGGNAGAMALGLGSFGKVGYSASGGLSAGPLSTAQGAQGAQGAYEDHWIGWFAQNGHLAYGIWAALLIAPAMLIYVAMSIARLHGSDTRSVLTSLGTWLVSLIVAIPVLAAVANLSIAGAGTVETGSFSGHAEGSANAGLSTLLVTFTVFAYALVVGTVIAILMGARSTQDYEADTDPPSSPR